MDQRDTDRLRLISPCPIYLSKNESSNFVDTQWKKIGQRFGEWKLLIIKNNNFLKFNFEAFQSRLGVRGIGS
jgi:hypothetical protein